MKADNEFRLTTGRFNYKQRNLFSEKKEIIAIKTKIENYKSSLDKYLKIIYEIDLFMFS